MARLLINGEFFDEISPSSYYESEFEAIFVQQSPLVFPKYHVVPFKTTVYSNDGAAKADLALVEHNYKKWWVVEIELDTHSFTNHVLPQVRILANATYAEAEAEYLCRQSDSLEFKHVLDMMKGNQPQILVVANRRIPDWLGPLDRYAAVVIGFQIFRSDRNRQIFQVDSPHPFADTSILTDCYCDPLLPRFLILESPAALNTSANAKVFLRFDNQVTEWLRIDASNKVWLTPIRNNPLSPRERYQILESDEGIFPIQLKSRTKGEE